MTIQINFKNIVRCGLVITLTSLSFATIAPTKVAFAEPMRQRSVAPPVINEGMNGTWDVQWKVNGWLHRGRLTGNNGIQAPSF